MQMSILDRNFLWAEVLLNSVTLVSWRVLVSWSYTIAPPELPGAPQSATSATSNPTCNALAAFTFQILTCDAPAAANFHF